MSDEPMPPERRAALERLAIASRSDPAIRQAVLAGCRERAVANLVEYAGLYPALFDEFAEEIDNLLEQAPTERVPGWMR
jgi:hypothetical protein